MREILFRGKGNSKYNDGAWYEGYLTYDGEDYQILDPEYGTCKRTVIAETVGQYTGLTDKNGNKIFEGDIFKFNDEVWERYYTACGTEYDSYEVKNYGVVGFDEDRLCFDFVQYKFNENSVEADLHENYDIEFADFISELEVIGNIHDNSLDDFCDGC